MRLPQPAAWETRAVVQPLAQSFLKQKHRYKNWWLCYNYSELLIYALVLASKKKAQNHSNNMQFLMAFTNQHEIPTYINSQANFLEH